MVENRKNNSKIKSDRDKIASVSNSGQIYLSKTSE